MVMMVVIMMMTMMVMMTMKEMMMMIDDGWRGWPWWMVTWHHLSWTSVIKKIYT